MNQDKQLSVQDVAELLELSKNTVYDLIKRGELSSYRIGRKLRIDPQDVEHYKNKSRTNAGNGRLMSTLCNPPPQAQQPPISQAHAVNGQMIICGQDMLLDVLTQYLQRMPYNIPTLRSYIGSYNGLVELYKGNVTIASAHLWDSSTNEYNIPYVHYLLPGIPCQIINLAYRMQGFYVAQGNPKNIQNWNDLVRPDVVVLNREIGCGVRVLVDESLKKLRISKDSIQGYDNFDTSHLAVASAVSRGGVDVAIGNQKTAMQVDNIDFIPLKKERLDLVIPSKTPYHYLNAISEILNSKNFRDEVTGIGGYDISETGTIIAKT